MAQAVLSQAAVAEKPNLAEQRRRHFFQRKILPWLFVLPILAINFVVIIGPSLSAIAASFTNWNGIGTAQFIGLDNYQRMLTDADYGGAFIHNLTWLAIFMTVPFVLALTAASLLAPLKRGGMLIRTAVFIPYVLPSAVNANIWRNLLSPTLGIGAALAKMGVTGLDHAFLGDPNTALPSAAFVDNWHFWGFLMVLFLSAMQSVPPELYDAARVDGANRWQEFINVTIPGIRPTLVFMLLMVAIWSFLAFDYVYILTQGGPAGSSEVLGTLVLKAAIHNQEYGYASAIGLSMAFFAAIVIGIFTFLRRRGWEI